MTDLVLGAELHEGDTVLGIDGPHLIDHFGPYPGAFAGDTARRAYDATGHWCCTVADHERFHIRPRPTLSHVERTVLAAALRWARHTYRPRCQRLGDGWQHLWYADAELDNVVLVITRLCDGRMRLDFDRGHWDAATVGEALAVLTAIGVYDPPDERGHAWHGDPGPLSYAVGGPPGRRGHHLGEVAV